MPLIENIKTNKQKVNKSDYNNNSRKTIKTENCERKHLYNIGYPVWHGPD